MLLYINIIIFIKKLIKHNNVCQLLVFWILKAVDFCLFIKGNFLKFSPLTFFRLFIFPKNRQAKRPKSQLESFDFWIIVDYFSSSFFLLTNIPAVAASRVATTPLIDDTDVLGFPFIFFVFEELTLLLSFFIW